jgi:hypothetical protein
MSVKHPEIWAVTDSPPAVENAIACAAGIRQIVMLPSDGTIPVSHTMIFPLFSQLKAG